MNENAKRCFYCGAKSRSLCPAIGKDICPSCCGSRRGSQINCSSDCSYYPFSVNGYDLWLKMDASLAKKMFKYIVNMHGKDYFEKAMKRMSFKGDSPSRITESSAGSAAYCILFVTPDKDNKTLVEYWKDGGWQGLNNDERTMMNCRFNSRVTIIEIQKILDYQAMECIDLLDQGRGAFIMLDRATASSAIRFTRLFTWLTHYPNFSKVENNGIEITDLIYEEFMEMVHKEFNKESKKRPGFTIKDYLSENFGKFCELGFEIAKRKNVAMLEHMDLHHCRAVYKIQGAFSEIKAILDSYPDFEKREKAPGEIDVPGAHYYSWIRRGGSKALEKEMSPFFRHDDESQSVGTLGNIILTPELVLVEVFTKQKFVFAKKMMEKYFKGNIVFQREMVVDMAKQFAQKLDSRDESELPEEEFFEKPERKQETIPIEVERKVMKDFYQKQYKNFLNEQIPMLSGMTPRQAAKEPSMRPKLIELIKQHLKGIEQQNREKNLGLNIDWVLDELNLAELK